MTINMVTSIALCVWWKWIFKHTSKSDIWWGQLTSSHPT